MGLCYQPSATATDMAHDFAASAALQCPLFEPCNAQQSLSWRRMSVTICCPCNHHQSAKCQQLAEPCIVPMLFRQDYIGAIRTAYEQSWEASDRREQQMGVALYFIDKLALRAGHEKEEDEADTVGCCTLKACYVPVIV